MLKFRPITIEDRPLIHTHLYGASEHGCEYTFANLFLWADQRVAFVGALPIFLCRYGRWYSYLLPQGGDLTAMVQLLRNDANERGVRLRLFGLSEADKTTLNTLFPSQFRFRAMRDSYDYLYNITQLCTLNGKHLQAKRNHCNRFEAAYPDYRIVPLDTATRKLCEQFTLQWYEEYLCEHPYVDITEEQGAIRRAFLHFDALEMEGIAICTQAEGVVAFSFGNRIRENMFDVNFEKARADINGAYSIVNRDFARTIHEKYPEIRLLNREDDMGIEGLRRAKESYLPDRLLEKYVAEAL